MAKSFEIIAYCWSYRRRISNYCKLQPYTPLVLQHYFFQKYKNISRILIFADWHWPRNSAKIGRRENFPFYGMYIYITLFGFSNPHDQQMSLQITTTHQSGPQFHFYHTLAGRVSSIGSVSAWHASGPEFDPHIRHILSWRIGREQISMAILSLPLIQDEQLSVTVTDERMCTKYW